MYDDVLISVDQEPAQLLQILEFALGEPVSATDICTELGINKTALTGMVKVINRLSKSAEIQTLDEPDDTYYLIKFFDLSGAHVPYGKTFEEKEVETRYETVEKPVEVKVEVPVYVPQPVNVGSALQRPSLKREKSTTKKRAKKSSLDNYVWPDTPEIPDEIPDFTEPEFYKEMKSMLSYGHMVGLSGPPGVGKTTSVVQLAHESNVPLVTISASAGLRQQDLEATPEIVRDGNASKTVTRVLDYANAVVNGYWVLIDEINTSHPDIVPYLMSQLAPPYSILIKGKSYPVHPDFRLIIAYNPGLAGTKVMNAAFLDRFYVIECPYPDELTFKKWLYTNGVDNELDADHLWTFTKDVWSEDKTKFQLSPRRIYQAVLLMINGVDKYEALSKSIIPHVINPTEKREMEIILNQHKETTFRQTVYNPKMEIKE